MKQGRLETDSTYANKIQKQIYKIIETNPEKLLSITNNKYIKAIYINELNRYIVTDDYGNIMETANGWGYKTINRQKKPPYMPICEQNVECANTEIQAVMTSIWKWPIAITDITKPIFINRETRAVQHA